MSLPRALPIGKSEARKRREAAGPESRVLAELRAFERRIDSVLLCKEVVMKDVNKPCTGLRTLRLSVYNTFASQGPVYDTSEHSVTGEPTWTLRIEGQLLGGQASGRFFEGHRFTSFFRKVVIHLDDSLAVDGNVVEWDRDTCENFSDGFEVQRAGNKTGKARIQLHLHHAPARYRLSSELSELLGLTTDTRSRIVVKFWYYVKNHNLRDPKDRSRIVLDEPLRRLFRCDSIQFSDVPDRLREHLAPAEPIEIEYDIKLEGNPASFVQTWDIQVPEQPGFSSVLASRDIQALESQLETVESELARRKRKRDFLLSFSTDPVGFLENLIASVAHDYRIAHGHPSGDSSRLAAYYEQAYIDDAVSLYLAGLSQASDNAQ